MIIGTWAVSMAFLAIATMENAFVSIMDAVGLWGFYTIMVGSFVSVTYTLGPMVINGLSGSDKASRRKDVE